MSSDKGLPGSKVRIYKPIYKGDHNLQNKFSQLGQVITGQKATDSEAMEKSRGEPRGHPPGTEGRCYQLIKRDQPSMMDKLGKVWIKCFEGPEESSQTKQEMEIKVRNLDSRQSSAHTQVKIASPSVEKTPSKKSISLKKSSNSKASGLPPGKVSIDEVYKKYNLMYTQVFLS